jgi:hypothetical protein
MPKRDVEWTLWVTDKEMIQRLGVCSGLLAIAFC